MPRRKDVSAFPIFMPEKRGSTNDIYWIFDQITKTSKLIKNNDVESIIHKEQDVIEKLASDILKYLKIKCMNVELGTNNGKNCCILDNFLTEADSLYDIKGVFDFVEVNSGDIMDDIDNCFTQMFWNFADKQYEISNLELEEMRKDYVRIIFGDCILSNYDRHSGNVAVIYNEQEEWFRLAPSYDNANSFIGCDLPINYECRIGNQNFKMGSVLIYILQNHYEYIEDIVSQLDDLVAEDLFYIIGDYNGEINPDKQQYIFDYISTINEIVQSELIQSKKM